VNRWKHWASSDSGAIRSARVPNLKGRQSHVALWDKDAVEPFADQASNLKEKLTVVVSGALPPVFVASGYRAAFARRVDI
jgi:hypothetical protein